MELSVFSRAREIGETPDAHMLARYRSGPAAAAFRRGPNRFSNR